METKETTEKIDWVEKAIEYEATPKSLREPKTDTEFIDSLGIPRSTYYYEIAKIENQKRIIDICFKQAKKRTPQILDKLGQKAEDGDNQSIGMFMDYVLEKTKKTETEIKGEVKVDTLLVKIIDGNSTNNGNTEGISETAG